MPTTDDQETTEPVKPETVDKGLDSTPYAEPTDSRPTQPMDGGVPQSSGLLNALDTTTQQGGGRLPNDYDG